MLLCSLSLHAVSAWSWPSQHPPSSPPRTTPSTGWCQGPPAYSCTSLSDQQVRKAHNRIATFCALLDGRVLHSSSNWLQPKSWSQLMVKVLRVLRIMRPVWQMLSHMLSFRRWCWKTELKLDTGEHSNSVVCPQNS